MSAVELLLGPGATDAGALDVPGFGPIIGILCTIPPILVGVDAFSAPVSERGGSIEAAFLAWSAYFSRRRRSAAAGKTRILMLGIGFGATGLALASFVYGSRTTAGVVLAAVLVVAVSYAFGHLPADTTNDKGGTNSDGKMSLFGPVMAVLGIATSALATAAVVGNGDFDTGWQQSVAPMTVTTAWLSVAWWVLYFVDIDCIGWTGLRATSFGRVALQVGILLETSAFVGSGLLLGSLPDATSPAYAMLATAIALKGLAWTGGHVGVHAPETLEG